jgi:hypothetical protein
MLLTNASNMDDDISISSCKEAQVRVAITRNRRTRAADSVPRGGSIIITWILDDFLLAPMRNDNE